MVIFYKNKIFQFLLASTVMLGAGMEVYARAGGGGSSSGGGGGSIFLLPIFVVLIIVGYILRKKAIARADMAIHLAEQTDSLWEEGSLKKRVSDVFFKFQKAWGDFDVESIRDCVSDNYYRRMILELNVLKNQHRQNLMENLAVRSVEILSASDSANNTQDTFTAEIRAKAEDILLDTADNKKLFVDNNAFTEYWIFKREGDIWKLDTIGQATEASHLIEKSIVDFARKNGFFYDPDFGWLMMPSKGAIFSKSSFGASDINNHVIGYFREKIVEFYTYCPVPNHSAPLNYLVAQAILPIQYYDILVKRRKFFNFSPKGLRKMSLESIEFNQRFCIFADPRDQVNTLELLTPNFMEKIYGLPFDLNIEIVGHFLYFYTKSRKNLDYNTMLEILTWAFNEMKM